MTKAYLLWNNYYSLLPSKDSQHLKCMHPLTQLLGKRSCGSLGVNIVGPNVVCNLRIKFKTRGQNKCTCTKDKERIQHGEYAISSGHRKRKRRKEKDNAELEKVDNDKPGDSDYRQH